MIMLRSTNTKVHACIIAYKGLYVSSDMNQRRLSSQERAWSQKAIPRVNRDMFELRQIIGSSLLICRVRQRNLSDF